MTYEDFIERLRREAKDYAMPMHNDFTGDGSTTLFQVTDKSILESSYVVKVNGSQVDEGSGNDYTLDRDLGLITFAVAPTDTHPITIDYKYVHVTNEGWIEIINKILTDMQGEFFREVVNDDFGDTVAEQIEYAGPTSCIDVIQFWYKTVDSTAARWRAVQEYSNWRFSKEANTIYLGRHFDAVYPTKLHYLKGYTLGDEIGDTLDIQEDYEGVLQLGCMWRYYDYRLAELTEYTMKNATESTLASLNQLRSLSQHYYRLYLKEKGRKKPTKPMRVLFKNNPRGGTP